MWSVFSRLRVISALLLLALAAFTSLGPGRPAAAAPREPRCFPQTGLCINGRFRDFWQQHGGLPIFGAPITPTAMERNPATGQRYMTQWYEGARFEYHPENPAPDDVLLGNLGAERLHQLGIDWRRLQRPPWAMPRDCLVFNENGRYVCDEAPGVGFKTYWLTHGVRDPRLSPYQQSLALFGLPLTWATMETNSSGERVLTQWFERARFEWHPDKPTAFKVLLGRLGSEIRTGGKVSDVEQARTVLLDYFNALHDGHYDFASQHYGGSYLPLQHANPAIAPNDHAALFQAACTDNGYQCLIVKRVVQQAAASSTMWTFTVEFVKADGTLFKPAALGSRSQFPYSVHKGADGSLRVGELPVYLPTTSRTTTSTTTTSTRTTATTTSRRTTSTRTTSTATTTVPVSLPDTGGTSPYGILVFAALLVAAASVTLGQVQRRRP